MTNDRVSWVARGRRPQPPCRAASPFLRPYGIRSVMLAVAKHLEEEKSIIYGESRVPQDRMSRQSGYAVSGGPLQLF